MKDEFHDKINVSLWDRALHFGNYERGTGNLVIHRNMQAILKNIQKDVKSRISREALVTSKTFDQSRGQGRLRLHLEPPLHKAWLLLQAAGKSSTPTRSLSAVS